MIYRQPQATTTTPPCHNFDPLFPPQHQLQQRSTNLYGTTPIDDQTHWQTMQASLLDWLVNDAFPFLDYNIANRFANNSNLDAEDPEDSDEEEPYYEDTDEELADSSDPEAFLSDDCIDFEPNHHPPSSSSSPPYKLRRVETTSNPPPK